MMVVPVLITSCHVSEYPKAGPQAAHTNTAATAQPKAVGEPAHFVTCAAKWSKNLEMTFVRRLRFFSGMVATHKGSRYLGPRASPVPLPPAGRTSPYSTATLLRERQLLRNIYRPIIYFWRCGNAR